jgi:acyl dehydratase
MPIDYEVARRLMAEEPARRPFSYSPKDVMLYALSIGLGDDPLDERELGYVYERQLRVVPTAVTVLANGVRGNSPRERLNVNFALVLHGEQSIELHKPLPTAAEMTTETRLTGLFDKGKDKGAVIINETTWREAETGEPVATLVGSTFARGDGGFGGPSSGQPEPHQVPGRSPDLEVPLATRPGQPLLYRLNGDLNPLHADPETARKAGFAKPILHGLCTYGITCRAILQSVADYDAGRIKSHAVRFSAPVYPGETIVTRIWKDGEVVSFEAYLKERPDVTVIKNGRAIVTG